MPIHLTTPSSPPAATALRLLSRTLREARMVLAATAIGALSACSATGPVREAPTAIAAPGATVAYPGVGSVPSPSRIFDEKTNIFVKDVRSAPLHHQSEAMIAHLLPQVRNHWGGTAAFATDKYNPTYVVVPRGTRRTRVEFDDCQLRGETPSGLYDGPRMFVDVPIPNFAAPSAGTDSTITLYDPNTDQLWEFWVLKKSGQRWSACWGGRLDNVSGSSGVFPPPYGSSASGLVTSGGMVTLREAKEKKIEHAMELTLIHTSAGVNWYPANRNDGNTVGETVIPEGARLRLDPAVDVDALDVTPFAKAVARAAQKYGFIVTDTAGAVGIVGESASGQTIASASITAKAPSEAWQQALGDEVPPYAQMKNFPWDKVQVLRKDWGKPS